MAENTIVARPYAEAAFELARESDQLSGWSDVLRVAAATVSDPDVAQLIDAPGRDTNAITGLIVGVCEAAVKQNTVDGDQVSNLFKLLAEYDRLPVLPEISEAFDKLKADVENTVDVVLTAASPVTDQQQQKIAAALKKRLGREIKLHFQLDENLIGGARLQADDLIIDGSVRAGLEKMSSALVN
jgi:F-type H+-transporting ATPase subunit delta